MHDLNPLGNSHAHDVFEEQLKQLLIKLYQATMADRAKDINVYGTPFLGSRDLILKSLVADNIGNFEAENVSTDVLKYLLLARRYLNGKRGLNLLDTYLRALWQADYKAYQLYFKKDGTYAEDASLFSPTEMVEYGGPASNYVRTSRVRIELNPDGDTNIPADVADTLDDTLPARLFVHDIVVKRDVVNRIGYANVADYISFTSEVIDKVQIEVAEYLTSRPYGIESVDGVSAHVKMVKGHDIEMLQATEASEEKVAANVSMQEAVLRDILIEAAIDPDSVKADVVVSGAIQVDLLTEISIEQDEVKADMAMVLAKLDDVLLTTDTTPENLTANVTVIGAVLSDE